MATKNPAHDQIRAEIERLELWVSGHKDVVAAAQNEAANQEKNLEEGIALLDSYRAVLAQVTDEAPASAAPAK